jgi:transposase-like protein
MIEKRLRQFRKPHCGSIRVDETYVKIRGRWRYLYRAIDKHGNPVDFLLTAKRDLDAAASRKEYGRKAGASIDATLAYFDQFKRTMLSTVTAAIKDKELMGQRYERKHLITCPVCAHRPLRALLPASWLQDLGRLPITPP